MRLKLVIIASLVAAILGAGLAILLVLFISSSVEPMLNPGLLAFTIYLLPVLTTLLASIFVYRHTARRRKLQAALTAIISLLLSLALFLIASIASAPPQRMQPPTDTPRNST
jgi:cytochrome bd-type quinol oxidase subunit 2